jgi:hypothetical protein
MMQAVAEVYVPDAVRKVRNRVSVVSIAAEEVSQSTDKGDKARVLDDDWLNQFMRFSEDASSERLQLLFGKILAGEVVNPGSFSPSTLRAVSELTQKTATDFEWAWARNFDDAMLRTPDFQRGESWERLVRLREAGLVSPNPSVRLQPDFVPVPPQELGRWAIGKPPHWLLIYTLKPGSAQVPLLEFTIVGNELGRLLAPPDWAANLRAVASAIPKSDVARIDLYCEGRPKETVWTAPDKDIAPDA